MTRLTDFLALVADPDLLGRYEADPEGFMIEQGVPSLARAAVHTGMTEWIEHLATAEVMALRRDSAAPRAAAPASGRGLTIVGTGMKVGQMTLEARAHIVRAPKLLYAPGDPVTERVLLSLNPTAESLAVHYRPGLPRRAAYEAMVDRILAALADHGEVCAAFYGHPGVFVTASHSAIDRARAEGWPAEMLPGVSSLDCLFADLGLDPFDGCIVLEAETFVRKPLGSTLGLNLILLQIAAIYEPDFRADGTHGRHLSRLVERLVDIYPPSHPAIVYEAPALSIGAARIAKTTVGELAQMRVSDRSTLHVPALDDRIT